MNTFKNSPFLHPFLFAAFPVLFLLAENKRLVEINQIWTPLGLIFLFVLLIFLATWLLFRNVYKAGILTSAFIVLFFLYRPVFTAIQHETIIGSFKITRNRQLILVFLLPLIGLGISLFRSKRNFKVLAGILNATGLILLLPSVLQLCWSVFQPAKLISPEIHSIKPTSEAKPDIYYFIMDAYARADVLKQTFNYDNQPFLKALQDRGFYIATKSTSNYQRTDLSIPSTLNLNYYPAFVEPKLLSTPQKILVKDLVSNSRLRKILKENQYKYVCYASGVDFTEIEGADHYLNYQRDLSEFDLAVFNTTPLPEVFQSYFSEDLINMHRSRVLYPFKSIQKTIAIPAPKFVQIHILSPHPPFVFDRHGNAVNSDKPFSIYTKEKPTPAELQAHFTDYTEQIQFINTKLLQAVDTILAHSKTPPVIVIQGDHGSRINNHPEEIERSNHFESFANLSTFYLPNQDTLDLYPAISNVNTFRVIFNKYLNAQLPLLPDKSYYSKSNQPYEFTEVTRKVKIIKTGPIRKH